MRRVGSKLSISLLLVTAALLTSAGSGRAQPGTARSFQKISDTAGNGTVLSYKAITDTQGNFNFPLDNLDQLGDCVTALGDLDAGGPSVAALAVGATGDDDGGTDRGAVYILFLDADGNVLTSQKI